MELDVNFIDMADSYGPYVSEELIAEALFPYPADLNIATKGGWNLARRLREASKTAAEPDRRLWNEGQIRLVALSNVTQEHIERARRIVPIVSVQNRYSFADREWDYVVDYCERNEIAFIPWFPLGAGKVAGEVLNRIAQAHGASPTQVALAWLLRRSPIMLPIPGTSSTEHLEENVAAASLRLTDKDYQMLSRVPALEASR